MRCINEAMYKLSNALMKQFTNEAMH